MISGDDPTRRYLGEIGTAKLLTAEEEVAIGRRIEEGQIELRRRLLALPSVRRTVLTMARAVGTGAMPLGDLVAFPEDPPTRGQLRSMKARLARLPRGLDTLPLKPSVLDDLVRKLERPVGRPVAVAESRLAAILEQDGLVREAKRRMIEANLRLVVSVAKRYAWSDVPLLDRIQDGNLGLMKAVDRFQYRRGFKFSTYAMWWIRQSIVRGIADRGRTIRIPVHLNDTLNRLAAARRSLLTALGREPTPDELARRLRLPVSRVRQLLETPARTVSLQMPIGEDAELGDFLEDMQTPAADVDATRHDTTLRVRQALDTLPEREREVLRLHFGIGDGEHTLEEIGSRFSLTRERIRQIELQALRKLQRLGNGRGLLALLGSGPGG